MTFDAMKPVHELWVDYINALRSTVQRVSATHQHQLRDKVMRADLHGALIRVVRSRNATVVGTCGYVLVESKMAFQVVTRQNAIRLIPKLHTVFDVYHPTAIFRFYGDHLLMRAAERSIRKFKSRKP